MMWLFHEFYCDWKANLPMCVLERVVTVYRLDNKTLATLNYLHLIHYWLVLEEIECTMLLCQNDKYTSLNQFSKADNRC